MPIVAGEVQKVNTTTVGYQNEHEVTALADGGWVVAWTSNANTSTFRDTVIQAYNSDGSARGGEHVLTGNGQQYDSSVAALADGGWVVTWSDGIIDGFSWGVAQQVFAADGTATTGVNRVNTSINGLQYNPQVVALTTGGWIVTWHSSLTVWTGETTIESTTSIGHQLYNSSGEPLGPEIVTEGDPFFVTSLANGGWLLTYEVPDATNLNRPLYQQAFDSDGNALRDAVIVREENGYGSYFGPDYYSIVAAGSDGGWAIAYHNITADLYLKTFDADGVMTSTSLIAPFVYHTDVRHTQHVTTLENGNFVVSWTDREAEYAPYYRYQRLYTPDGAPMSDRIQLAGTTGNLGSENFDLTALSGGGWVSTWFENGNLYQSVFNDSGQSVGTEFVSPAQVSRGTIEVAALPQNGWIVTWEGIDSDVYQQAFHLPNEAPVAVDDTITADEAPTILLDILANDTDADGNPLSVTAATITSGDGQVTVGDDGRLTYHDDVRGLYAGETRAVVISYTVDDGNGGTDDGIVTLTINGVTEDIVGTEDVDVLQGSDQSEKIYGLGGNDVLKARGGDDWLFGGEGDDRMDGGAGADHMEGGSGHDNYIVDDAGDVVIELADGGIDWVHANFDYTLGENVEGLSFSLAAGDLNGTGNDLVNALFGTMGNNTLDGAGGADLMMGVGGDDTYIVDNVDDTVYEAVGGGHDLVKSSVSFILSGAPDANLGSADYVEDLTLTGTADINGTGNSLANTLRGNSGNNILDGAGGADLMMGGDGDDTYIVDNDNDFVAEAHGQGRDLVLASVSFALPTAMLVPFPDVEDLTLTGGDNINATGNELANTLRGNSGNNVLDGGAGRDSLIGGAGNDTYLVDSAIEMTTTQETADGGIDTVQAAFSATLATNLENLILLGAAAINGNGNALGNIITGNAAANILDGKAGADTLQGGAGDDIYQIDNSADKVLEFAGQGNDTVQTSVSFTLAARQEIEALRLLSSTGSAALNLTGNEFNNALRGNSGNNVLDGRAGADVLQGLGGNDTYQVDNIADKVIEAAGQGTDVVQTSVSYALSAGQEIETLRLLMSTGSTALNLTGNEFANTLIGNSGSNVLDGKAGADILQGGAGDDTYQVDNSADKVLEYAGQGNDTVQTSVSFTLAAGQEIENVRLLLGTGSAALNLTGNEFNNALRGNSGNNVLDGKAGADVLQGFGGNDTYQVDNIGDVVIEAAGQGTDVVQTSISYTLSAGQEIETLRLLASTGSTALNLTGNAFANTLIGNSGSNVLDGKAGADVLQGGAGSDVFLFTTATQPSNVDHIVDFSVVNDMIHLSGTIFTSLTTGNLAQTAFKNMASGAVDSDDRILYDKTTGVLSYDADGSGTGADALQIAILDNKATLTHQHFLIV